MIFLSNDIKEVIYDSSEITERIILNKIFRWSFYLKNQFTIQTEPRPIYVPLYLYFPTTYTPRYGYEMEAIETTFQGIIDF